MRHHDVPTAIMDIEAEDHWFDRDVVRRDAGCWRMHNGQHS